MDLLQTESSLGEMRWPGLSRNSA